MPRCSNDLSPMAADPLLATHHAPLVDLMLVIPQPYFRALLRLCASLCAVAVSIRAYSPSCARRGAGRRLDASGRSVRARRASFGRARLPTPSADTVARVGDVCGGGGGVAAAAAVAVAAAVAAAASPAKAAAATAMAAATAGAAAAVATAVGGRTDGVGAGVWRPRSSRPAPPPVRPPSSPGRSRSIWARTAHSLRACSGRTIDCRALARAARAAALAVGAHALLRSRGTLHDTCGQGRARRRRGRRGTAADGVEAKYHSRRPSARAPAAPHSPDASSQTPRRTPTGTLQRGAC